MSGIPLDILHRTLRAGGGLVEHEGGPLVRVARLAAFKNITGHGLSGTQHHPHGLHAAVKQGITHGNAVETVPAHGVDIDRDFRGTEGDRLLHALREIDGGPPGGTHNAIHIQRAFRALHFHLAFERLEIRHNYRIFEVEGVGTTASGSSSGSGDTDTSSLLGEGDGAPGRGGFSSS